MTEPLRVAAVNAAPIPGDVAGNVVAAAVWCRLAAAEGAGLLVFPEAWTTGYCPQLFAGALPSVSERAWLDPLQEAVDEVGVVALLNSPVIHTDGRRTLTTIAVAPGMPSRPLYDKQHLYPPEIGTFSAGESGATLHLGMHQIALSVCYDVDFPEHAAAAGADGATIYVNSGAYFPGSEARRDLRYAARALDNGMYVVFSGLAAPDQFVGGSAVYDPLGQPLARLQTEHGLAVADADLAMVHRARESQRAWADRRTTLGRRVQLFVDSPAMPMHDALLQP